MHQKSTSRKEGRKEWRKGAGNEGRKEARKKGRKEAGKGGRKEGRREGRKKKTNMMLRDSVDRQKPAQAENV